MRRIHAWSRNKKGEFNIPVYHIGPWWAVIGEEITWRIINLFFDINHWFEKFTHEYEDKKTREKS